MDLKVTVALIAAGATAVAALTTAVVSLIVARAGRKAATDLEKLKAELGERSTEASAERNARIDYEYDARKRLYQEIEPLLFQLFESLEEAHYRVRSLARSSRHGNLPNWLVSRGYYLHSTVYKLILPAVFLRLIQRHMTFVDLRADRTIRTRYQLLKLYSRSYTDDFDYAALNPQLPYDPNRSQGQRGQKTTAQVFVRQGLLVGDLECICDAMIVSGNAGASRAMFFSEFEVMLSATPSNASVEEAISLLTGFAPGQRPVLARLLIVQAVMSELILSTYASEMKPADLEKRLRAIVTSKTANHALEWQRGVSNPDLSAASQYWEERLKWLTADSSWIEMEG